MVLPCLDLHPEHRPSLLGCFHLSNAQNLLGWYPSYLLLSFLWNSSKRQKSIDNDITWAPHRALSNPNILLHICFRYTFLKVKLYVNRYKLISLKLPYATAWFLFPFSIPRGNHSLEFDVYYSHARLYSHYMWTSINNGIFTCFNLMGW